MSSSDYNGGGIKRFTDVLDGERYIPDLNNDVALICLARVDVPDTLSILNTRFNKLIKSGYLYVLRKQIGIADDHRCCSYYISRGLAICFDRKHENPTRVDASYLEATPVMMSLPNILTSSHRHYTRIVTVANELMAFAHREYSEAHIWKYNVVDQNWVIFKEWAKKKFVLNSGYALSTYGSIAIMAGGVDRFYNRLNSADLYDSSTGKWKRLPNMHIRRVDCAGFFMDEKFYVIGGEADFPQFTLTCGEEFDLKTRQWRKIEGMYEDMKNDHIRNRPPFVVVIGNQLYGVNSTTRVVKRYNKELNSWDVLGTLPVHTDEVWCFKRLKAWRGKLVVIEEGPAQLFPSMLISAWCPRSSGVTNHGALDWQILGRWYMNHEPPFTPTSAKSTF